MISTDVLSAQLLVAQLSKLNATKVFAAAQILSDSDALQLHSKQSSTKIQMVSDTHFIKQVFGTPPY